MKSGWTALRAGTPLLLLSLSMPLLCRSGAPECRLTRTQSEVVVRLRDPGLFAGTLEKLLDSGFELVLDYEVELLAPGGRSLGISRQRLQAAHDLWNEQYVLLVHDGPGAGRRTVARRDEALALLREAAVRADSGAVPRGPLRLRLRASLAPASAAPAEQSREWLSHGRPSGPEEDASGLNLFTAFAHLLVTPDLDESFQSEVLMGPCTAVEGPGVKP